jgi:hypothetical protein
MITIAWPMAKQAQSYPQITPVKFASLHIFDIFNGAGADYTD